ncbi:MAG: DUF4214 domain-containing protein [Pyrinomonadaceae bacterium]
MLPSHSIQVGVRASKLRALFMLFSLILVAGAIMNRSALVSIHAAQNYSISGKVADGFGNGIAGATVTLGGTQAGTTTTDDNGNYSFTDLAAGGNYTLTPSKAGQYTSFAVNVNNLMADQTVNLRLDPYLSVTVHVTDANGNGVSGVSINVNNSSLGFPPTNSSGFANFNMSVAATNDSNPPITIAPQKPGYTFNPPSATIYSQSGSVTLNFTATVSNTPVPYIQFSASSYSVGEGDGSATITVTRTGDTSSAVGVSYFTGDAGVATQKRDYTMAGGTLSFAPGETSKTFPVLITDNAYVQGNHGLFLQLAAPTGGASLGTPKFVTLGIVDNDTVAPTSNPLEDAQFFVRQHYNDFLNRAPDQGGLDYWTSQFAQCGSDADCLRNKRLDISAAFFVELEFQQTGYVVYRLNRAALGLIPDYTHFMMDRNRLVGGPQLDHSTQDFANAFVESGIFKQFYPDSMTPEQFVGKLFDTAGLKPYTEERQQEINTMKGIVGRTRAQVLLDVIEIPAFKQREYNNAFVLMQYYGYLRRDPDSAGYSFWLNILNNKLPNDASGYRAMVCAFITSAEYQDRFSPVRTRSDAECGR